MRIRRPFIWSEGSEPSWRRTRDSRTLTYVAIIGLLVGLLLGLLIHLQPDGASRVDWPDPQERKGNR